MLAGLDPPREQGFEVDFLNQYSSFNEFTTGQAPTYNPENCRLMQSDQCYYAVPSACHKGERQNNGVLPQILLSDFKNVSSALKASYSYKTSATGLIKTKSRY